MEFDVKKWYECPFRFVPDPEERTIEDDCYFATPRCFKTKTGIAPQAPFCTAGRMIKKGGQRENFPVSGV